MIENFVNTIGLDGEYYSTTCNCPMSWGRPKLDAEGEFITPLSDKSSVSVRVYLTDEKYSGKYAKINSTPITAIAVPAVKITVRLRKTKRIRNIKATAKIADITESTASAPLWA